MELSCCWVLVLVLVWGALQGDALIWTEALAHGTLPWRCAQAGLALA